MLIQERNTIDVLSISSNANNIVKMSKPRRQLSEEEQAEALRLKLAFEKKKEKTGISQAILADLVGWSNQSAISQYFNGHIPLNLEALIRLCPHLDADPYIISPRLMSMMDGSNANYTPPTEQKSALNPKISRLIALLERLDQTGALPKQALVGIENILLSFEDIAIQSQAQNLTNTAITSAGGKVSSSLTDSSDIFKTAPANTTAPQPDYAALSQMAAKTNKKSPL
ncbi:helix-turn-helix domain-containing protein [Iodobacter fluviatilis]|uniref:HTH cro/C1-type domain-containing protein n=1 Tax=Iodobacter fluviatilis TaxID=537 RepID=A0A7G3GBJ2_9NEIS|nr:helix-turn-helix transcriptional regulator [Iodobacter fluviatilis]QBC44443.1 hypothetical protein C1H71_13490 [Iodobacter fluviatilis]